MEFTLTLDKKVQARIDPGRCVNCRECSKICPTGAITEYQKAVSGVFTGGGSVCVKEACSTGCPMGIIPQAVASLVREEETDKAYRHIMEQNPLAWVCAEICNYPCSQSCKLRNIGREAPDMRILERDVIRRGMTPVYAFTKPAFDRIAIIGGGPAGIMAAFELRRAGYRPVIFEKRDRLGGAMSWGIPDHRLDKKRLHEEIDRLIETGIEVRYHHALGENYTLQKIWEEGFAAILLCVGRTKSIRPLGPKATGSAEGLGSIYRKGGPESFGGIYGPDRTGRQTDPGRGLFDAVDLLRELNDGGLSDRERRTAPAGVETMGPKVVVVGNGRLASDVCQVLAAAGKEVTCLIPAAGGQPDMPEEMKDVCRAAGAELRNITGLGQLIRDAEGIKAVEVLDGSRAANLFCDAVVYAFGQKCDIENISKVETHPDGSVRVDETGRTNKKGIYACGEVTGQASSVVEALAAGRLAARAIDADLRGAGETVTVPTFEDAPAGETIYPENIAREEDMDALGMAAEGDGGSGIVPLLRTAGIAEEMPVFFRDEGPDPAAGQKTVAVVGGGMAGITAAIALAKKGIRPTIYEKTGALGGSCRWLASNRRFDRRRLDRELKKVEDSGIRVHLNTTGGVRPDIPELMRDYDAVLFAVGETKGQKPDIPGTGFRGVYDVITLMQELNSGCRPRDLGTRVTVAGSDETSVDIARALKRICSDVTLLSDCGKGKLRLKAPSSDLLLEEGINLVTGVKVAEITGKHGRVSGVSCKVLEHGSSLGVPCDTVVFGEGKAPDLMTISLRNLLLDIDDKGYIKTNSRLATSMRGVFAIGDFNMSSVDAGRAGAAAVENYLEQTDQAVVVEHFRPEEMAIEHERLQGRRVNLQSRQEERSAQREARRCISCGYHKAAEQLCIGCGICQRYCPVGAIWLEGLS